MHEVSIPSAACLNSRIVTQFSASHTFTSTRPYQLWASYLSFRRRRQKKLRHHPYRMLLHQLLVFLLLP